MTKIDPGHKGEHQNIARASAVLDVLARASNRGVRLKDIIDTTGLNNAAVFRVLNGLVSYGLAEQDRTTGRFVLGMKLFTWVQLAQDRFKLSNIAKSGMKKLAQSTGDTVYFSVRSGNDLVVIERQEGSYPIKTLTLEVGARRPLGVSAGGLALLAYLPDTEVEDVLAAHRKSGTDFPFDEDNLRERILEARKVGFVYYDSSVIRRSEVISGVTAIALPVRNADGIPVAAISVAALTERLQPPRQEKIVAEMREEAAHIETLLAEDSGPLSELDI